MTLCPWERTLGKVMLQPGVVPSLFPPLTSSSLSQPTPSLPLSPSLSFSFFGGDYRPPLSLSLPVSLFSSSYLSSISILLTQYSSTLLIFSFIFLPASRPHLSLSHRMLKSQWTGYKNMNSTSVTESIVPFQAHRPCSHISRTSFPPSLI